MNRAIETSRHSGSAPVFLVVLVLPSAVLLWDLIQLISAAWNLTEGGGRRPETLCSCAWKDTTTELSYIECWRTSSLREGTPLAQARAVTPYMEIHSRMSFTHGSDSFIGMCRVALYATSQQHASPILASQLTAASGCK